MKTKTFFSLVLSALLLPAPGWTQQVSGPKSSLVGETGGLKIVVLQGEGALNSIKSRTATQPVVEVRDDSDKPVEGAEVVFQLPASGAGGVFNGWMRSQTTRTNAQGQAAASGMTPNDQEGRFNIKVTATQGKRSASAVIAQSNTASGGSQLSARSKHKTLWVVLGLAAVGGIAGGIAGTRGGSSAAAPAVNPVTIMPGPVSVGTPR